MKQYKIVLLISILFLFFSIPALAQDTDNKCDDAVTVCDSPRLVVELEQARNIQEQNKVLKQTIAELSTQISLLSQKISLMQQKLDQQAELQEITEKVNNERIDQLKKDLEEAEKPRYKAMFASAGVGSILTLVLILAIGL